MLLIQKPVDQLTCHSGPPWPEARQALLVNAGDRLRGLIPPVKLTLKCVSHDLFERGPAADRQRFRFPQEGIRQFNSRLHMGYCMGLRAKIKAGRPDSNPLPCSSPHDLVAPN